MNKKIIFRFFMNEKQFSSFYHFIPLHKDSPHSQEASKMFLLSIEFLLLDIKVLELFIDLQLSKSMVQQKKKLTDKLSSSYQ